MNTKQSEYIPTAERASLDTRLSTTLLAAAFPLFSLLLYLPGTIYFSNADEFSLRLRDIVLIFVPAFVLSTFVALVVLRVLSGMIRGRFTALSFGLGIALWIQGSLLLWQYGPFNGRAKLWEDFWLKGIVDTPIWLFFLGTALVAPAITIKVGRAVAMIIMALQVTVLFLYAGSTLDAAGAGIARNYVIDSKPKYVFSSHRNVILFVLDAFQSDAFREIIESEPKYARYFDGFTWFRDAVAVANNTAMAVPGLLTGRMYDNSEPRDDFMRRAFLESGITTILKRAGFVVDIYPWIGWGSDTFYFDEAVASNLTFIDAQEEPPSTFTWEKRIEAMQLLDFAFFRAAPQFLKPWIFNDHKWFVSYIHSWLLSPSDDEASKRADYQFTINTFLSKAPATLETGRGQRVFKYFHLQGPHSPLTVNEKLEFTGRPLPFSREAYLAQAKANLQYLHRFLCRLRDASIFDSSLILVVGDHGSGLSAEMWVQGKGADPIRLPGTKRDVRQDQARALPLVLIKPVGARGPLKKSEAPVSLGDVPATILSELGLETIDGRPSMFEVPVNEPRTRYFMAFDYTIHKSSYVMPITLYRIEGDSWLGSSWTEEGILFPRASPPGDVATWPANPTTAR